MKQFIYADNAATTKLNKEAFNAMIPWLTDEYGNASQPYAFARKPKKALAESRKIIAKCINALPEEIYFTSGGTESDNWAIKGSASSDPDKRATITSAIEHHALLNACASIERNRQISRRIKKHLWLSNRSWARDVHSFGILHSWGALAGKSCSAQASSIWLIAGAFRRTQSK